MNKHQEAEENRGFLINKLKKLGVYNEDILKFINLSHYYTKEVALETAFKLYENLPGVINIKKDAK